MVITFYHWGIHGVSRGGSWILINESPGVSMVINIQHLGIFGVPWGILEVPWDTQGCSWDTNESPGVPRVINLYYEGILGVKKHIPMAYIFFISSQINTKF